MTFWKRATKDLWEMADVSPGISPAQDRIRGVVTFEVFPVPRPQTAYSLFESTSRHSVWTLFW